MTAPPPPPPPPSSTIAAGPSRVFIPPIDFDGNARGVNGVDDDAPATAVRAILDLLEDSGDEDSSSSSDADDDMF